MLDVNGSGRIEFDEFYLLIALFVAVKVNEKNNNSVTSAVLLRFA